MIPTEITPSFYSHQCQEEMVDQLDQISWERCITLTTKTERDVPDLVTDLSNFIRRVGGKNNGRFSYWFGLCQNIRPPSDLESLWDGFHSRLHIHGVLGGVDSLTNEQIKECWRTVPVRWSEPDSGIEVTRPFLIGHPKVTHYDGRRNWLYYVVSHTRHGEVVTNVDGFREEWGV